MAFLETENCKVQRLGRMVVRFNHSGAISISNGLAEFLEIKDKDRVIILQDENERSDLFIAKEINPKKGFIVRDYSGPSKKAFTINSASLVRRIQQAFEFNFDDDIRSIAFLIGEEKSLINGYNAYPLLKMNN